MCRSCPVPEWSEPIRMQVVDLPQYFSKQISWNFERLNFGNAAVLDSGLEKPIRPTITGKVGCKLREGATPVCKDRFLLVSECLFCPGRRYGCTPRANCTGKRRHCWAQCKVSIYADRPDMAEVYYSGDHGEGDVNDINKHRPRPDVINDLKRKRKAGASPLEALQWFKKCVNEQGLNTNDPRQVPSDTQIKKMLKRIKPDSRPTMAEVGLGEVVSHLSCKVDTSASESKDASTTETAALDNSLLQLGSSVPELTVQNNLSGVDGDVNDKEQSDSDVDKIHLVRDIGTSTSASTSQNLTNFSPLNTPFTESLNSRNCARGSSEDHQRSSHAVSSSQFCQSLSHSVSALSSQAFKQQNVYHNHFKKTNERCDSMMKLKHHIYLLEQENLSKISRIAELETELYLLKEQKLMALEQQVKQLQSEGKKKDLYLVHLEKQLQDVQEHHKEARPLTVHDSQEDAATQDELDVEVEERQSKSNSPVVDPGSVENGEVQTV